jgi:hypothetical protein
MGSGIRSREILATSRGRHPWRGGMILANDHDFAQTPAPMEGVTTTLSSSPTALHGSHRQVPSIHLHPLTGSGAFYPKTIPLPLGNRVVVGRSQAGDTEDGTNGLFPCQWMSRNHALIWSGQDGKVCFFQLTFNFQLSVSRS